MKLITLTLITLLTSSYAFAARVGDAEMKCSYVIATTTKAARDITIIPSEVRGEITLKQENGTYKAVFVLPEGSSTETPLPVAPKSTTTFGVPGSSGLNEPIPPLPIDPKTPDLKINFEATLADQLNLSIKVTEVRFSQTNVLVSTTSLHSPDASGVLSGSQIVRNPDVETIALKNNIEFSAAALSESLPNGLSFIGAMITCN